MKKQLNPTIKAHLIRSAFYILLLVAVCLIPFALAQRNTTSGAAQLQAKRAIQTVNTYPGVPVGVGSVIVTATGGNTGPTSYLTLQLAFAAINIGVHQGVINVAIVGDTTETVSAVLNATGGTANYTSVSVQPSGGVARTISGAILAGSPLIDLSGATNVTIDGIGTGGNSLTISNTTGSATAGTSTIRFIDGASNERSPAARFLGRPPPRSERLGQRAVQHEHGSWRQQQQRDLEQQHRTCRRKSTDKGVMALGSASPNDNTNNLIDNNNIFDFFSPTSSVSGVSVQNNNDSWTISNNRIFQTASRIFTGTALRYAGITLNNSSGAFTVTDNVIGFGAADGTGTTTISGSTNEFRGLDLADVSTTTPTSVQGNVISGINQTSARNITNTGNSCFTAIALGSSLSAGSMSGT